MRCYFSLNLGKDQKTSTSKNLCLILNVEIFDVDLFQFNRLGFFQKFVATTGPISEKEATSGGGRMPLCPVRYLDGLNHPKYTSDTV